MKFNQKTLLFALAGVSLFAFSFGVSYLVSGSLVKKISTSSKITPTPSVSSKKTNVDSSLPKTEICPLNGAKFTTPEKDAWSARRPLAVIIENHLDSRPLSGLGSADIVYEAVAEGGITRHMGIFYCGVALDNTTLAPVRSARIYFTKIVPEYDALYNHVGGAGNCDDPTVDPRAKALCFIHTNKIKDLDQFGLDFKACHRLTNRTGKEVAYEHTMACFTDELYKVAAKRGWTNVDSNLKKPVSWDQTFVPWKFKEDSSPQATITNIKFGFWNNKPDYDVAWKYDPATNTYLRSNGGQPVIDLNLEEPVRAKNVIIQFVKETGPVDEHLHMLYEVTGTGKTLLFQNGQVVSGTWSKSGAAGRTKFLDTTGKEIQLSPGQIWIELLPSGNTIEYN